MSKDDENERKVHFHVERDLRAYTKKTRRSCELCRGSQKDMMCLRETYGFPIEPNKAFDFWHLCCFAIIMLTQEEKKKK